MRPSPRTTLLKLIGRDLADRYKAVTGRTPPSVERDLGSGMHHVNMYTARDYDRYNFGPIIHRVAAERAPQRAAEIAAAKAAADAVKAAAKAAADAAKAEAKASKKRGINQSVLPFKKAKTDDKK